MVARRQVDIPLGRDRSDYLYDLVAGGKLMTDRERRIYRAGLRDGYASRDLGKGLEDSPALRKVGL